MTTELSPLPDLLLHTMPHRLTLLLLLAAVGCSDADADKLRRVGDKTYDRVSQAALHVADELGQTLLDQKLPTAAPTAATPDLVQKVQNRLAWDRDLAGLSLQVSAAADTITLKGVVKSDAQKQRAVQLAETTVGVAKVIADLDVAETEKPPELPRDPD